MLFLKAILSKSEKSSSGRLGSGSSPWASKISYAPRDIFAWTLTHFFFASSDASRALRCQFDCLPSSPGSFTDQINILSERYFLGSFYTHYNTKTHKAVAEVVRLAKEYSVCILGIMHLNKTNYTTAIDILNGSVGFGAKARVVY